MRAPQSHACIILILSGDYRMRGWGFHFVRERKERKTEILFSSTPIIILVTEEFNATV